MVQLFPRRLERPMYGLFAELAEIQVQAADTHSTVLGSGYRERMRIAPRLHEHSTSAEEIVRRIANRLADSLITPYEAELLYSLALTVADSISAMEHSAELLVLFHSGTQPTPLLEAAKGIERCAELTVTASWKLDTVRELGDYYAQVRKVARQGRRLTRQALGELYARGGSGIDLLPQRDVIDAVDTIVELQERAARTADLLRVKDA